MIRPLIGTILSTQAVGQSQSKKFYPYYQFLTKTKTNANDECSCAWPMQGPWDASNLVICGVKLFYTEIILQLL